MHHGLSCIKNAGHFPRHSAINSILKRSLIRIGLPSVLESVGLTKDRRSLDGLTLNPCYRGRSLVWDAKVVDTFAERVPCKRRSSVNSGVSLRRSNDVTGVPKTDCFALSNDNQTVKCVRKEGVLGLNTPLELDILHKFYYLRKEINCFRILFAC